MSYAFVSPRIVTTAFNRTYVDFAIKTFEKLVREDLTMKTFHKLVGKETGQTDLCPLTIMLCMM